MLLVFMCEQPGFECSVPVSCERDQQSTFDSSAFYFCFLKFKDRLIRRVCASDRAWLHCLILRVCFRQNLAALFDSLRSDQFVALFWFWVF